MGKLGPILGRDRGDPEWCMRAVICQYAQVWGVGYRIRGAGRRWRLSMGLYFFTYLDH